MQDKIAEILLKLKAVTLNTEKPYKWASGILSPVYTDNRILMSYPTERDIIINSFFKTIKIEKINFYGVAGTATAGIPWAAWIAQKLKKPLVYARSSPKDHGKGNLVEGKIEKNKKYIVVEDLISTGSSSLNTINAIRGQGSIVDDCIAIFSYGLDESKNNFQNAKVKLSSLTNFENLIKTALKKRYIKKEELDKIMEWKIKPKEFKISE